MTSAIRNRLADRHGRVMRKLRVSLTDACNYNCFYCMPAKAAFTPKGLLLEAGEYRALCGALVEAGIEELRVTGGEPTVRPEFRDILTALAELPVRKKGMTTNGHLLGRHLEFLRGTGWTHLNVSLDSLDPGRFSAITGGGDFRVVMDNILRAASMGFTVKVNAVIMRGVNEDELADFAVWSAGSGIEVRFLEYMRIGPDLSRHAQRLIGCDEMEAGLAREFGLSPVATSPDSTSRVFTTAGGARLGFIASETRAFCADCSRLRLSATGFLRACVMGQEGISIRNVPASGLRGIFDRVVDMKPLRHAETNPVPMYALGG